jgi:hypothetical protein
MFFGLVFEYQHGSSPDFHEISYFDSNLKHRIGRHFRSECTDLPLVARVTIICSFSKGCGLQ